jgi:anti-sigma28 factor (negative regulator of flagellin synthesis)
MPSYEHYAKNPQTGEHVGWDGSQWVPVHPREVPGTVANTAAARQPRMQTEARTAQREARPDWGDRLGSVASGAWDTTLGAANAMGQSIDKNARENPLLTLAFPGLPTLQTLTSGMVEGVKSRGSDMGEALDRGDYLRAAGDAIAIGTAPVGGTAFADVADTIRDDPSRALGQALGIAGTFALPKAVQGGTKATGSIGRGMQRSAAKRGALAVGARKLPEIESLYKVDPATNRPQGPIVDLLNSPDGLPVASTQNSLRNKLVTRDRAAGAAVGGAKAAIQPGQYVLDPPQVRNTLLRAIDSEIGKRTNTVGGRSSARPDGRPLGRTTADTTAIDNLEAAKQDIMQSVDPATGALDLYDLFGKIDTWDDVYESAKVQNNGHLEITSRAFTDKLAADSIRRVLGEQIPGLRDVNREFHAVRTARDTLEKKLDANPTWLGPRGKRYLAYLTAGGTSAGMGALPGVAVAGGAAALETIGAVLQSTPVRTWSANRLYRFGKFLEAGELQQAAQVAQEAQQATRAAPTAPGAGGPAGAAPPPTPRAALQAQRNVPRLPEFDPNAVLEAEILPDMPSQPPPPQAQLNGALGPRLSIAGAPPRLQLPPAPVDTLSNGAGLRVRAPLNVGESGALPLRNEQTVTPRRLPTPYEEVAQAFDDRNALVANEAGKIIDDRNANLVLKDVAAVRKAAAAPPAPPTPPTLPAPTLSVKPAPIPASAAEALGERPRNAVAPKPAAKPKVEEPPASASTSAKPVDYSTMSEVDLRNELRKATQVRDNNRKIGAGSNMFRKSEERVKEIERAISAGPKRVSANRKGQRIEGVFARSFKSSNGRKAMILRADDNSERLVFEDEIAT